MFNHSVASDDRDEIVQRIFENSEAMKRGMYTHMLAYFHGLPISRAQVEVLSAISFRQPVSSKDVAHQLYLTPGAVSQSVENLEQLGYLVRKTDRTDRRIQYLQLSKKGESIMHDITMQRQAMMEKSMESLTLTELTLWLKVQTKLSEQFKTTQLKAEVAQTKIKMETK
jgi:MarR family 2-MHQ and catechol resistance regulon transcriptional repressor